MNWTKTIALSGLVLAAIRSVYAAPALPALNVDKTQISVSGFSSGGFMAVQLSYAHASTFTGVGVFAGGPYMCGGHHNHHACIYNSAISDSMLSTMQADIKNWSGTRNDPVSSLAAQKVFLFVGTNDTTTGPKPTAALNAQFAANGVTADNKILVERAQVAHTFPTDFDSSGNNDCSKEVSPRISNCGYDGAKAVLEHFYGKLNERNDAPAAANYIEFDQRPFIARNPGMAATGWIYVPAACTSGASCKLHVVLHGCRQNPDYVGDKFVKNTGYTRWGDTNNIIVLFPQTRGDNAMRSTSASGSLNNPHGCWDWAGWYGVDFAQKTGTQTGAIKAMVDRVASGK